MATHSGHEQQLQALQDTFVLGMLVGDADLCASVYAPHARILPPTDRMRVGREEICDYWQQVIDAGGRGDVVISEDVERRHGWVRERGVYARFPDPVRLGKPLACGTYTLLIEPQSDGSWAWAADIWTVQS